MAELYTPLKSNSSSQHTQHIPNDAYVELEPTSKEFSDNAQTSESSEDYQRRLGDSKASQSHYHNNVPSLTLGGDDCTKASHPGEQKLMVEDGASELMNMFRPPNPKLSPSHSDMSSSTVKSIDETNTMEMSGLPMQQIGVFEHNVSQSESRSSSNGVFLDKKDGADQLLSMFQSIETPRSSSNEVFPNKKDGAEQLLNMFQSRKPREPPRIQREVTDRISNSYYSEIKKENKENTGSGIDMFYHEDGSIHESSLLLPSHLKNGGSTENHNSIFHRLTKREPYLTKVKPGDDIKTKSRNFHREENSTSPSIANNAKPLRVRIFESFSCSSLEVTLLGSMIFSLYHVVFCLALSSSITRHYATTSVLLPITKMCAIGTFFTAPIMVKTLGSTIPALYPSIDLFLAPFYSKLALIVDESLQQRDGPYNDSVFLSTFIILCGLGVALSACFSFLASRFKLANLGNFLPNAVLCGFFSSVGFMLWGLAFKLDTGMTVGSLWGEDIHAVVTQIIHHVPTLMIGLTMFIYGSRHPFYLIFLIFNSIMGVYFVMLITGTSFADAQKNGWFWDSKDLQFEHDYVGTKSYIPPAPFAVVNSLFRLDIDYRAIYNGLDVVVAMAFIYALRCSLHATALRKNVSSVQAIIDKRSTKEHYTLKRETSVNDEAAKSNSIDDTTSEREERKDVAEVTYILDFYAVTQLISGFAGGFPTIPNIAVASTLTKVGAEGTPPQYGSVFILFLFYITSFKLVRYVPKITFSSLLVLTFLDLLSTWLVKSFRTTQNKYEWFVVPLIIISSNVIGSLGSVAFGIGLSTIIFVSAFYQTGVVKYTDTGLTVRSTIERSSADAAWLDENGDLIQVMVLQNYLFFGNASSCLNYIKSMFEEVSGHCDVPLPPFPKYLVIDFCLCTGMDTSAVKVLSEIVTLCKANKCKLIMSGLSPTLRDALRCGDVKTSKKNKYFGFRRDLDTALGYAEDDLLSRSMHWDDSNNRIQSNFDDCNDDDDGFVFTLGLIDEQHGTKFTAVLSNLAEHTKVIDLDKDEILFMDNDGFGRISESERGLCFIQRGMVRVERDSNQTLTRTGLSVSGHKGYFTQTSIGQVHARLDRSTRNPSVKKLSSAPDSGVFRLARLGPGWVITDSFSGSPTSHGTYKAVTPCRLHVLPYETVEQLEESDPVLILNLFKMLSHVNARRQDVTINHLALLHSIIGSPPLTSPSTRLGRYALQKAANVISGHSAV